MRKKIVALALSAGLLVAEGWDVGFAVGYTQGVMQAGGFKDVVLNDYHNFPINTTSKSLALSSINSSSTLPAEGVDFGFYTDWVNLMFALEFDRNIISANSLLWMDLELNIPVFRAGALEIDLVPSVGVGQLNRSFGTIASGQILGLDEGYFYDDDTIEVSSTGIGYGGSINAKLFLSESFALYGKYGYKVNTMSTPRLTITKPSITTTTTKKDGTTVSEETPSETIHITDNNAFDTSSANYNENINPFDSAWVSTTGTYWGAGVIFYFNAVGAN